MTDVSADSTLRGALKRGLWMALALAAGAGLVVAALSRTELGQEAFADLPGRTDPLLLALSLVVMSTGMLFVALRWRALIPAEHPAPPPIGLTLITCAALLVNYALPGPVGELAAAGLVRYRYGVPASVALAAGLYGRFIGLGIAGLGITVLWLSGLLPVPPETASLVGGVVGLVAFGATAGAAVALRPRWISWISERTAGALAQRLPGRLGVAMGRADAAATSLVEALGQIGQLPRRSWLTAAGWSLSGHTCVATGIWLGAVAIGAEAAWAGVLFTYLASAAAVVAIFAIPGGQLAWDALFFGFLTVTAGVTEADALAITALQRFQQILLLLIGATALAWLIAPRGRAAEP